MIAIETSSSRILLWLNANSRILTIARTRSVDLEPSYTLIYTVNDNMNTNLCKVFTL